MKKKLKFALAIWLLLSWKNNSFAQDVTTTGFLAKQALVQGDTTLAISMLTRVSCFGSDSISANSFLMLADIYYQNGEFFRAYNNLEKASFRHSFKDSAANEILIKKALCMLRQKNYDRTLTDISLLQKATISQHQKAMYLSGLAHLGNNEWKEAKNSFISCFADTLEGKRKVDSCFKLYKPHRPNSGTAQLLSIFLPGAGQLYAGDVKNSVNSLLLNTGLTVLFITTWKTYHWYNAFLSVFPWSQRYYLGGIQKAGMAAEKRRARKKDALVSSLAQLGW